ncbi:ROK family protein [Aeromonas media]|uniref:ROK family protein n=1 Tax=Aeromonas media TaxID=651 RepID=A0A6M4YDX4_AERME|nr:ROK family protein [Aeromonas media]MBP9661756.1 ROK family protein [Aeromonas sp.]QJT23418.1 ROK family protein [Aeromonas media]QYK80259.1 ROK family protein [Aeromonas media]
MLRLGLDIGGTKIEAQLLDGQGVSLLRRRIATPTTGYGDFLAAITDLVREIRQAMDSAFTIGIGLPGAIDPLTGRIKNANCLFLNGQDLKQDLTQALGQPVWLANDADCFALSEAVDGAGETGRVVFGIILGTGCGGGLVVNRQLIVGPNAITGEWGHNPLPGYDPALDGPTQPCYCGRSNCIERFVSGTGFAGRFVERHGRGLSPLGIITAAAEGDVEAEVHYDHFIQALARSVASLINVLDPDVIVLGGGLSNIASLYRDLPAAVIPYLFSEQCLTPIVPARYGDSSGVRGAAWLPSCVEGATTWAI